MRPIKITPVNQRRKAAASKNAHFAVARGILKAVKRGAWRGAGAGLGLERGVCARAAGASGGRARAAGAALNSGGGGFRWARQSGGGFRWARQSGGVCAAARASSRSPPPARALSPAAQHELSRRQRLPQPRHTTARQHPAHPPAPRTPARTS